MKYSGLHQYLDEVFHGRELVSEEEVIQAKADYWRAYNTNLKQRGRKLHREFSIRFSNGEFETIVPHLSGKAVSTFIRRAVLSVVGEAPIEVSNMNTALIEQQLYLITQIGEELGSLYHAPQYLISDLLAAIEIIKSHLISDDR